MKYLLLCFIREPLRPVNNDIIKQDKKELQNEQN